MAQPPSRDVLLKVRKLARLAGDLRRTPFRCEVTRLTSLKSLCHEPAVANRFVTYLARKTLGRVERGKRRAERLPRDQAVAHRAMMREALEAMEGPAAALSEARCRRLGELRQRMEAEQNEYRRVYGGPVRIVRDVDLLLFEYALRCLLEPDAAGHWAYQTARLYAERYDPRHGDGLIPASAPLVQDVADFWIDEYGLDRKTLTGPAKGKKMMGDKSASPKAGKRHAGEGQARFTPRQGQFLAFIHVYRKLHRQGPAELDLAQFFRVTLPSIHGLIVKLEELGLVTCEPGVARSVRVVVPEAEIPALEDVAGPPW
jgi:hypothetical protein